MTAVLDMQHPAVLAMLEDQRRFDEVRLRCPAWCDGDCETFGHMGDAIIHCSAETRLASMSASADPDAGDGVVRIKASRYEHLDETPELTIDLDVSEAAAALPGLATFTAQQARALIAAVTAAVERIDPAGGAR